MRIPEVREKMSAIADELLEDGQLDLGARLHELVAELVRRPQHRHRKHVCRPVTPEIEAKVVRLRSTTGLSQYEIAKQLDINSGRVSEILHGFRE